MKLSKPQIKALRFSALKPSVRPRNFWATNPTWESLYKRGLVTRPPWMITEEGKRVLAGLDAE